MLEAEKETTPKIEAKAQEVKEQTKGVREEVGARAKQAVGSTKEVQKEASAQVEDTVNVAQDTIDLVSALPLGNLLIFGKRQAGAGAAGTVALGAGEDSVKQQQGAYHRS